MPDRSLAVTAVPAIVVAGCLTLAPTACGAPSGFPDLDAFHAVDPASYTTHFGRGGGGVFFATPDGLQCGWASLANGPDDHVSPGCTGPLPGVPGSDSRAEGGECMGVGAPTSEPSDLGPYGFKQETCPTITSAVLHVGQKITAANTTCLVGADRLTACIDPILNRGFVLEPSGSWTF